MTGPRKRALNAGIPELFFILNQIKRSLSYDTKIDLLIIFYPELRSMHYASLVKYFMEKTIS